jgi:putative heme-binding domain-containing protein
MTVPPGFSVELVAAEPALVNPVAMTIDERGRFWVTESLEYPRREPGPGRDRVKVLEDTDNDGTADKVTTFAEGLNIPSGIAVGHGGVWVANSPDILFYPDADRDAIPDGPPQVVVTGFGRDDTHELPNSLTWGPDGWLYGWNGVFNPSKVKSSNGTTYEFTCAVFRIHPLTREFQIFCEGTSNPWGLAINEDGELFASACVIDHLWHLSQGAYYIRQGGPYPPHTWPMRSIVEHTHQKAAYCGIHWFDSDAYPEPYRKKLFMGNIHGNGINVDSLTRAGATYKASPEPDFLAANDAWFMPVAQKTGPDGSLCILDWYDRYHCYQDANRDPAGIDRLKGRLYRVRYQDSPRVKIDLAAEPSSKLIQRLGEGNDFLRSTARRLLIERALNRQAQPGDYPSQRFDPAALSPLITGTDSPRSREALFTRVSIDSLDHSAADAALYARLLDHPDPVVRAWTIRAFRNLPKEFLDRDGAALRERFARLVLDRESSPIVMREYLTTFAQHLGTRTDASFMLLLGLANSPADPLITHLVWQRLHPRLDEAPQIVALANYVRIASGETSFRPPHLFDLWPRLVARLASSTQAAGLFLAETASLGIRHAPQPDTQRQILRALSHAARDGNLQADRLAAFRNAFAPTCTPFIADPEHPAHADALALAATCGDHAALESLARTFADPARPPELRASALEILTRQTPEAILDPAVAIVADPRSPAQLRERTLATLAQLESPQLATLLLESLPQLEPALKPRVLVLLTERATWANALLDHIDAGKLAPGDLNPNQVRKILAFKNPELNNRVAKIWGAVREGRNEQRELVVSQMRQFLAKTPGNPLEGQKVFTRLCAQCHKIYGEGQDVGPDITLNGRNDYAQLLSNVFDPNLVIGPGYQAVILSTTDGRVLNGLPVEQGPDRVLLKLQGGAVESIPRAQIDELQQTAVSLMPEDLEKQMTPQEIADLFAFLALDKPPADPSARLLPGAPQPAR